MRTKLLALLYALVLFMDYSPELYSSGPISSQETVILQEPKENSSLNKKFSEEKKQEIYKKEKKSKIKSLKKKTKQLYQKQKESLKQKTKDIYYNKKKIPSYFFDLFCYYKGKTKSVDHAELTRQNKDKEDDKARMCHDLDYISDFYRKDRINVIKDNWSLHQALIKEKIQSESALQLKKRLKKPFFVEQEAFSRAAKDLHVFEERQNAYLDEVHLKIRYPHRLLDERFQKAYKVIYDPNKTDLTERYTFEERKAFTNRLEAERKEKMQERSLFSWVYAINFTVLFPFSFLIIKKIVNPNIPS